MGPSPPLSLLWPVCTRPGRPAMPRSASASVQAPPLRAPPAALLSHLQFIPRVRRRRRGDLGHGPADGRPLVGGRWALAWGGAARTPAGARPTGGGVGGAGCSGRVTAPRRRTHTLAARRRRAHARCGRKETGAGQHRPPHERGQHRTRALARLTRAPVAVWRRAGRGGPRRRVAGLQLQLLPARRRRAGRGHRAPRRTDARRRPCHPQPRVLHSRSPLRRL